MEIQEHAMQVINQQEYVVRCQYHVMMGHHQEQIIDMEVVMHDVNIHGIIII